MARPWLGRATDSARESAAGAERGASTEGPAGAATPSAAMGSAGGAREEGTSAPGETAARVARAAGTAVHRALECLDLGGDPAAGLSEQRAELPRYIEATEIADEPLTSDERLAAVARAEEILAAMLAGEMLDRLRAIAPHVLARELPLVLPPDPGLAAGAAVGCVVGSIDLLFRDPESGECVIVDYKTGSSRQADGPGSAEAVDERHRHQGRVYREGVQAALGLEQAPRVELWWLARDSVEVLLPAG